MPKVGADLTGTDNLSPKLQNATQKLIELRRQIDAIKAKGEVGVSVADVSNLNRLTAQAGRLERGLAAVGTTGTQTARSLTSSFGGLQSALGGLGLGGLGMALGGAGLVAAGASAARAAVELGRLGEVNREVGIRFEAFAGSADQATRMIQAMSKAAQGGVDDEELMRSATLLLSTDLISTAEQMASVTRSALLLGDASQSATTRIEAFTNAMMSGSARALRQFGITSGEVEAKIAELRTTTSGLSDEQLRANAVMEIAAQKAQQIAAAGGQATTSTQQLTTAVGELKDELAAAFAGPVSGGQRGLTGEINGLTALISALRGNASGFGGLVDYYQSKLNELNRLSPIDPRRLQIPALTAALAGARGELDRLSVSERQSADASVDLANGLAGVAGAANLVKRAVSEIPDKEIGITRKVLGPELVRPDYSTFGSRDLSGYSKWLAEQERLSQASSDKWRTNLSTAFTSSVSAFRSAWDSAVGSAKGLLDLTPGGANGILAPGQNGPFENMYRALAVAKGGAADQWASVLGLTQEDAKRIGAQFEQGLITPEMFTRGLVDKEALVKLIRDQNAAKTLSDSVFEALAQEAGVQGGGAVKALFGGGNMAGVQTAAKEIAVPMVGGISSGLTEQSSTVIDGLAQGISNNAEQINGVGVGIADKVAAGIRQSTAIKDAIMAAVQNAVSAIPKVVGGASGTQVGAYPSGAAVTSAATVNAASKTASVTYIGGDSYNLAVNDTAAGALVAALVRSNRQQRLNYSMGAA